MTADRPELIPLDAPALVEASAGTGKTYAITTYFLRAILELGHEPQQILVVTFTKAATAELRGRIRGRIVQALQYLDEAPGEPDALHEVLVRALGEHGRKEVEHRLRNALAQMDQAAILTIHGFCQRLLEDHPLEAGVDFDLEVAEDSGSMLAELAVDFWTSDLYDAPEWLLRAIRAEKLRTADLVQIADAALRPGTAVLGPEPREVDGSLIEQWLSAHRDAAAVWRREREAVCAILLDDGALKRTNYPRKSVEKNWIPAIDELFARDEHQAMPGFFEKLTPSGLHVKKGQEPPRHRFFEACGRLWEADGPLTAMVRYAVFAFKQRFIDHARAEAQRRRRETAVFTFDDLLTAVHTAVTRHDGAGSEQARNALAEIVAKAYPLALVDEFQDTDSIQYGIFQAIYGEGSAIYVGDPKQAIYAFRGADIFSYLGAVKDIGERKHSLETNRRSDPSVVRAVNTLFEHPEAFPFKLEGIDFAPATPHEPRDRSSLSPAMDVVFVPADRLQGPTAEVVAPIVADDIARLLDSGATIEIRSEEGGRQVDRSRPVDAGDIAVLCRSKAQALEVTKALRALEVPASLEGGSSVLDTDLALELRALLDAALMPGDAQAVRRALLTSLMGVSPFELASMSDGDWAAWGARFGEWHDSWHAHGVLRFLEDMLRESGAEHRMARRPTARRDLTDLLHIEELLVRGERERRRSPVALMQWFQRLARASAVVGAVAIDDLMRRPDTDSGAVHVSTVHRSKGLEYGIVYCPFSWGDARLHRSDSRVVKFHDADGRMTVDLGSEQQDENKTRAEQEVLSEALRLLYVAVTRAKHRCTLFWGHKRLWERSALAYLLHGEAPGKLDEDAMRADVEALAADSGGTIGIRAPQARQAERRVEAPTEAALAARPLSRRFSLAPRMGSFSSLTGHDEKTPGAKADQPFAVAARGLFDSLPGGARTGLLLHSIMEEASFDALPSAETRTLVERMLRGYGFDASLADEVQRDLVAVGATPLMAQPGAPSLADLPCDEQLRELEFTLSADEPRLDDLAELLAAHGAPCAAPDYHERLRTLDTQSLQRFLRGYVDLVFRWQGRWYVADYKSNKLAAYDPGAVAEAMQRNHYLLQAQLYSAAAQRHLRQRVLDYDPEEHWGGALFLFVRGMRGTKDGSASVFFDRQSASLLQAVDAWLGVPA